MRGFFIEYQVYINSFLVWKANEVFPNITILLLPITQKHCTIPCIWQLLILHLFQWCQNSVTGLNAARPTTNMENPIPNGVAAFVNAPIGYETIEISNPLNKIKYSNS